MALPTGRRRHDNRPPGRGGWRPPDLTGCSCGRPGPGSEVGDPSPTWTRAGRVTRARLRNGRRRACTSTPWATRPLDAGLALWEERRDHGDAEQQLSHLARPCHLQHAIRKRPSSEKARTSQKRGTSVAHVSGPRTSPEPSASTRVAILVVGALVVGVISWLATGSPLPANQIDALMVQSGLLLVMLSSTIIERHFSTPSEALVNSLTGLLSVIAVARLVPTVPFLCLVAYLVGVLLASLVTVARQNALGSVEEQPRWSRVAFRFCSELGRARVLFSIVFLTCVIFFVDNPSSRLTQSLVVFWGLYLAIWPLRVPQVIDRVLAREPRGRSTVLGNLERIDSPGLARVVLLTSDECAYPRSKAVMVSTADGRTRWGVPLFSENRNGGRWGTILLSELDCDESGQADRVSSGAGASTPSVSDILSRSYGLHEPTLVGLVQENSNVGSIIVELLPGADITLGSLLVVVENDEPVYYQVTKGLTREEPFTGLHFGSQVAIATQVGRLDDGEFRKFRWLPAMNAPVFLAQPDASPRRNRDFVLGTIPGSTLEVSGDFVAGLQEHTAVLGVTGSGKTEFAFDLIRHAVSQGVKVICVDLTAQYRPRLADLRVQTLSVTAQQESDLSAAFRAIDTGAYGGAEAKRQFDQMSTPIEAQITATLSSFVADPMAEVGLLELVAVANTRSTMWITERYLGGLLELGRSQQLGAPVLVVIEEAHTVMPEMNFVGDGSYDTRGTIARISQIALQGRKYGIGLLVVAQRTATVSKSVLTQCNTVISFSCMDETSINYLSNVFGPEIAQTLPQLPRRYAIGYGSWIRSETPISFEVPYSDAKASMSLATTRGAGAPVAGASTAGSSTASPATAGGTTNPPTPPAPPPF